MAEKNPGIPPDQSKCLSDSDTSDEELNSWLETSPEETDCGTIPGTAIATHVTLNHSTAQTNPTVEQGPQSRKIKVKKLHSQKAKDKTTQTD